MYVTAYTDVVTEEGIITYKNDYSKLKPYCMTRFGVFEKYEVCTNTRNHHGLEINQRVIAAVCKTGEITAFYNPLGNRIGLDNGIAKINIENEDSILKFCSIYGLLAPRSLSLENNTLFPSSYFDRLKDDYQHLKQLGLRNYYNLAPNELFMEYTTNYLQIELDLFKNQVQEFQSAQKLWNAIINKDEKTMHYYVEKFNDEFGYIFDKQASEKLDNINAAHGISTFEFWRYLHASSLEEKAYGYLLITINKARSGTNESLQLHSGKAVPSVTFRSPIDAAWWLLTRAISWKKPYKQCKYCGTFFIQEHGRREFCPPLYGQKRSSCQNAYSHRK